LRPTAALGVLWAPIFMPEIEFFLKSFIIGVE